MSNTSPRKIAAENAAKAITVGILLDACRVMVSAGAFLGQGADQARKVERWCVTVLGTMPDMTSARGLKNLKDVCDVFEVQFKQHWPKLPEDSGMSAVARIFTAQLIIGELRRIMKLKSSPWRYLDQTVTTLVAKMLNDVPEEEEAMFSAACPVLERVLEVAA